MRALPGVLTLLLLGLPVAARAGDLTADEARPRVAHHLIEAEQIVRHFETVVAGECPQFGTAAERRAYIDGEVDRVVLLVAHLDEAWSEAKRTSDKEVRRAAKAPRAQVGQAQSLVTKLRTCADGDGVNVEPRAVWRRIESEVPRRRAEIALP
jgi:hypothetical protein